MKKTLLIIAVCLFGINGFSQTFDVTTDTIEGYFDVSEYPSDYNYVVNNSGTPIDLSFDLLTNTIPAEGWTVTLCTHQLCFPSVPTTTTFGTLNDTEQGYFNVHVGFNNTPGDAEISFRIYETSNPSNADTIVFIYHATSNVGVNENDQIAISVYPNPTTSEINLSGLENLDNVLVNIYSIEGKRVKSIIINVANPVIDVADLENGTYIIEAIENDQKLLFDKFIKR